MDNDSDVMPLPIASIFSSSGDIHHSWPDSFGVNAWSSATDLPEMTSPKNGTITPKHKQDDPTPNAESANPSTTSPSSPPQAPELNDRDIYHFDSISPTRHIIPEPSDRELPPYIAPSVVDELFEANIDDNGEVAHVGPLVSHPGCEEGHSETLYLTPGQEEAPTSEPRDGASQYTPPDLPNSSPSSEISESPTNDTSLANQHSETLAAMSDVPEIIEAPDAESQTSPIPEHHSPAFNAYFSAPSTDLGAQPSMTPREESLGPISSSTAIDNTLASGTSDDRVSISRGSLTPYQVAEEGHSDALQITVTPARASTSEPRDDVSQYSSPGPPNPGQKSDTPGLPMILVDQHLASTTVNDVVSATHETSDREKEKDVSLLSTSPVPQRHSPAFSTSLSTPSADLAPQPPISPREQSLDPTPPSTARNNVLAHDDSDGHVTRSPGPLSSHSVPERGHSEALQVSLTPERATSGEPCDGPSQSTSPDTGPKSENAGSPVNDVILDNEHPEAQAIVKDILFDANEPSDAEMQDLAPPSVSPIPQHHSPAFSASVNTPSSDLGLQPSMTPRGQSLELPSSSTISDNAFAQNDADGRVDVVLENEHPETQTIVNDVPFNTNGLPDVEMQDHTPPLSISPNPQHHLPEFSASVNTPSSELGLQPSMTPRGQSLNLPSPSTTSRNVFTQNDSDGHVDVILDKEQLETQTIVNDAVFDTYEPSNAEMQDHTTPPSISPIPQHHLPACNTSVNTPSSELGLQPSITPRVQLLELPSPSTISGNTFAQNDADGHVDVVLDNEHPETQTIVNNVPVNANEPPDVEMQENTPPPSVSPISQHLETQAIVKDAPSDANEPSDVEMQDHASPPSISPILQHHSPAFSATINTSSSDLGLRPSMTPREQSLALPSPSTTSGNAFAQNDSDSHVITSPSASTPTQPSVDEAAEISNLTPAKSNGKSASPRSQSFAGEFIAEPSPQEPLGEIETELMYPDLLSSSPAPAIQNETTDPIEEDEQKPSTSASSSPSVAMLDEPFTLPPTFPALPSPPVGPVETSVPSASPPIQSMAGSDGVIGRDMDGTAHRDTDSLVWPPIGNTPSPGPRPAQQPATPKLKFLGVVITTPSRASYRPSASIDRDSQTDVSRDRSPENKSTPLDGPPRFHVSPTTSAGKTSALVLALTSTFEKNKNYPPSGHPQPRPRPPPSSTTVQPSYPPPTSKAKLPVPQVSSARLRAAKGPPSEEDVDRYLELEAGAIKFGAASAEVGEELLRMSLRFLVAGTGRGADVVDSAGDGEVMMKDMSGKRKHQNLDLKNDRKRQKPYAIREPPRADTFIKTLERAFGPGVYRGIESKPKIGQRVREVRKVTSQTPLEGVFVGEDRSRSVSLGELDVSSAQDSEAEENYGRLGKRRRVDPKVEGDEEPRPKNRPRMEEKQEFVPVTLQSLLDESTAESWAAALQKLIKGKTKLERQDLSGLGKVMQQIEETKDRVGWGVLTTSKLAQSIAQLSALPEIPFGDEQGLQGRARRVGQFWADKCSSSLALLE